MTITTDPLRRNLADLSASKSAIARQNNEIIKAAEDRHGAVLARLDELRPKVHTDQSAADEYGALVEERGQLEIVMGEGRR